ncbi:MAG TPA: hypothetical protein VJ044_19395, partial [Candidatus Hodarchaeales archaeon]|nr:hypothetical protein [Candidatus Hodarchaeales archaeon]
MKEDNPSIKMSSGDLLFYSSETVRRDGINGSLQKIDTWNPRLVNFRIAELGIHRFPQMLVEYLKNGQKYLQILRPSPLNTGGRTVVMYDNAGTVKGDKFSYQDLDKDGRMEIMAMNSRGNPISIYRFGGRYNLYEETFTAAEDVKTSLASARSVVEIERIARSTNPYLFAAAVDGLLRTVPGEDVNDLYSRIFNTEVGNFAVKILADPGSLNFGSLAAFFIRQAEIGRTYGPVAINTPGAGAPGSWVDSVQSVNNPPRKVRIGNM